MNDHATIVAQTASAMRVLGIRVSYPTSEAELEAVFDEIKRAAIEDWKSDEYWSKRRIEEGINEARIVAVLLDSVLMEYFDSGNLAMTEMRASELVPGMFARGLSLRFLSNRPPTVDEHEVHVITSIEEVGDKYDRAMRITAIARAGGSLGSVMTMPCGRIINAAVGVSKLLKKDLQP